jgi:formylglycine-generating enzyme required for sulfatase activity
VARRSPPGRVEQTYWQLCADNTQAAYCEAYLEQFPRGDYARLARVRLQLLGAGQERQRAPPVEQAPVYAAVAQALERPAARIVAEPEMVPIQGGCFQMGSPPSEEGRWDNERQHRVCVEDFRIGKTLNALLQSVFSCLVCLGFPITTTVPLSIAI